MANIEDSTYINPQIYNGLKLKEQLIRLIFADTRRFPSIIATIVTLILSRNGSPVRKKIHSLEG